jgi:hypothetical protein
MIPFVIIHPIAFEISVVTSPRTQDSEAGLSHHCMMES